MAIFSNCGLTTTPRSIDRVSFPPAVLALSGWPLPVALYSRRRPFIPTPGGAHHHRRPHKTGHPHTVSSRPIAMRPPWNARRLNRSPRKRRAVFILRNARLRWSAIPLISNHPILDCPRSCAPSTTTPCGEMMAIGTQTLRLRASRRQQLPFSYFFRTHCRKGECRKLPRHSPVLQH